jgi:hypothetical protein
MGIDCNNKHITMDDHGIIDRHKSSVLSVEPSIFIVGICVVFFFHIMARKKFHRISE